jgi:hypothetical protein
MENLNALPLATRQKNRQAVQTAMATDPKAYVRHFVRMLQTDEERVRLALGPKNANRIARAGQMVAAEIYHCPGNFAASAWKKLTWLQQRTIDGAFADALHRHGF